MSKILFIDDESIARLDFVKNLIQKGLANYSTIGVDKIEDNDLYYDKREEVVAEVLKIIDKHKNELEAIFLDVYFPMIIDGKKSETKFGYIIGERIREKYFNLPIVIYSKENKNDILANRQNLEIDGYIYKPSFASVKTNDFQSILYQASKNRKNLINSIKKHSTEILLTKSHYFQKVADFEQNDLINTIITFMPYEKNTEIEKVYNLLSQQLEVINLSLDKKFLLQKISDNFLTRPITNKIFTSILYSKLIIVIATDLNPNVMFELGMSCGLNRELILLIDNAKELPFNIHNLKTISYNSYSETELPKILKLSLEENLKLK